MAKKTSFSKARIKHEYRVASEVESKFNWLSQGGYDFPGRGLESSRRALGYLYINNPYIFTFVFKLKEKGL